MLLIYDETGFIQQTIIVGDFPALKTVYESHGKFAIECPMRADHMNLYVKDGEVALRPNVEVAGEVRPIAADGVDTLHFTITPTDFSVKVSLNDLVVHEETSEAGAVDFAVTEPGTYKLEFSAAFPRHPVTITVVAQ